MSTIKSYIVTAHELGDDAEAIMGNLLSVVRSNRKHAEKLDREIAEIQRMWRESPKMFGALNKLVDEIKSYDDKMVIGYVIKINEDGSIEVTYKWVKDDFKHMFVLISTKVKQWEIDLVQDSLNIIKNKCKAKKTKHDLALEALKNLTPEQHEAIRSFHSDGLR